jgi:hypothetical protein
VSITWYVPPQRVSVQTHLTEASLQIASGGIQKATIPTCIENGDYLLRFELIALHSAYDQGGAQFYVRPRGYFAMAPC